MGGYSVRVYFVNEQAQMSLCFLVKSQKGLLRHEEKLQEKLRVWDEGQAEAVGGGVSVTRLLCRRIQTPSSGPEDNWWGTGSC